MFSVRTVVFTLAAVLLAAGVSSAQTGADLAPKWKAGDETRYSYTADSKRINRLPAMKAEQEQKTRQEFVIRQKVVSTGAEGTELELVFERLRVVNMSGKMFIRVDTKDPPDPERANALDPFVRPAADKPIRVRLGADHRVIAIENIPKGTDAEGNPTPLVVDEELVRNSLAAIYSLEKTPTTANVGDRWTMNETLPAGPAADLHIIHTRQLAGIDGTHARIESSAIGDIVPKGASAERPPLLIEFSCKSRFEWDLGIGGLRWMTMEQRIETHGVVRQMRSEHVSEVRISIAREGVEVPTEKPEKTAP